MCSNDLSCFLYRVDAIYEKVDEVHYTDVQVSKSPAYEGVTIA